MSDNAVIQALLERRSIRAFKADKVDRADLETLAKCGVYAANGMNSQLWRFAVVTDTALLDEMVAAYQYETEIDKPDEHNFYHAPAAIVISGKDDSFFRECDPANAAQNICLAAHALGLGSCYIMSVLPAFAGDKAGYFRKKLNVPDGYSVKNIVAIGYRDGDNPPPPPRDMSVVTFVE